MVMNRRDFLRSSFYMALAGSVWSWSDAFAGRQKRFGIVLDDAGADKSTVVNLEKLAKEDVPVTVAVMPKTEYMEECLQILSSYRNADIILHQPMEPQGMWDKKKWLQNGIEPVKRGHNMPYDKEKGHTAIYSWDGSEKAPEIIHNNIITLESYLSAIKSPKRIVGLNNHMGSLITTIPWYAKEIAEYAAGNGLILLDSKTSKDTVLYDFGKKMGARSVRNFRFIDDKTPGWMRSMYADAKDGSVAIGHIFTRKDYAYQGVDLAVELSREVPLYRISEIV